MQTNFTTTSTKVQAPVWMVDYSAPLVNESRTGKRDASGKFLKLHVSMDQPVAKFSHSDVELASRFDCSPEDLFAGSR